MWTRRNCGGYSQAESSFSIIDSILIASGCVGVKRTPWRKREITFLAVFSKSCTVFGSAIYNVPMKLDTKLKS